jgi:hypothetical protein
MRDEMKEAADTFEKMLDERIERRNKTPNPAHNEGWIDALEHVVGMLRLRRAALTPADGGGEGDNSSTAGAGSFDASHTAPAASDAWMTSALPDIIEEAVDRLSRGFIYSLTPEGREYWWSIHRRLEEMAKQKRESLDGEGKTK